MNVDPRKIQLIMALRNQGVRDMRVLEAIEKVPRELFVNATFADQAYADQALPIACGQTISQPYIVGFMTDRLQVNERHKVLEIGTGSGYQTAILSHLCRRVYTIERYRTLAQEAEARFKRLKLSNITQLVADGTKGWPKQAPFERIIVTAAAKQVPQALFDQLAVGGIMIVPIEEKPGKQDLYRITRTETGFDREHLLPVRFVPLVEGVAKEM
ncbi:MAG: protein-L-isoaspartate(D-aspartate) O-methyltransferase [Hyphomicrobiales bacterium]